MTMLIIDKTGWLRMLDPWIKDCKSIDKIIIQAFNLNNPIDIAYIPFLVELQKSSIEIQILELIGTNSNIQFPFNYLRKVIKSKREITYSDFLLWLVDLLRYKNKYFNGYNEIKIRGINWINIGIKTKLFIRLFIKLIPRFSVRVLERGLIKLSLKTTNRKNPLIEYIDSLSQFPKAVILMPYCHSSLLNYDQVFLAKHLYTRSRIFALIGSWDNLTNKGSIKYAPDVLLVWNKIQEDEALKLCPVKLNELKRIGPIGTYKWGKRVKLINPNSTSTKKIILYACSSGGITDNELPAIMHLISLLRSVENNKNIHLIIRSHPKKLLNIQLNQIEFSNMKISISDGKLADSTDEAQEDLLTLLSKADLIVGINTSIFVECALFNHRPVTLEKFKTISLRHPHEKIIFDNNYGIEYSDRDFINDLNSNKIWSQVREKSHIDRFLNHFYDYNGEDYSPSCRFNELLNA